MYLPSFIGMLQTRLFEKNLVLSVFLFGSLASSPDQSLPHTALLVFLNRSSDTYVHTHTHTHTYIYIYMQLILVISASTTQLSFFCNLKIRITC